MKNLVTPKTEAKNQTVFLTGATGYVGGRLLQMLITSGYQIRCLLRRPEFLLQKTSKTIQVVEGDILESASLDSALEGVDIAFYLVHFLAAGKDFEAKEIKAAENFARAAKRADVKRIIYLSGLGHGSELSPHLAARHKTGDILRLSGIQTIELRAGIILGSGSLSFEMIRSLVDHLPFMVTPKWVYTKTQPIAIEDVLEYLIQSINHHTDDSKIYEIGSPDVVSYRDLMIEYARIKKLRRLMIPVPVLTPKLSSLWLGLVTPLYASVGKKLIVGLRNETVVVDNSALSDYSIQPRSVSDAIERALKNEDHDFAQTRWSDALSSSIQPNSWTGYRFGSRLLDSREIRIKQTPDKVFAIISILGGENGWFHATWLWRVRGFLDLLLGGVGYRRGRRNPVKFIEGDTVDFWRVEKVVENKLVRLFAEMKLPGRAWFQMELNEENGRTKLRQTAVFDPAGIVGKLYWIALYPAHKYIFTGLLREIKRRSENSI